MTTMTPIIAKAIASFAGRAEREPERRADARAAGRGEIAAHRELADDGADERADEHADDAEEEPDDGADRRTRHGAAGSAEALHAERARDEIHGDGERRKNAEHDQRAIAQIREVLGPGGEQRADEDQRRAGQDGQHHAQRADDDQHARGNPEHDRDGFHDATAFDAASAAAII